VRCRAQGQETQSQSPLRGWSQPSPTAVAAAAGGRAAGAAAAVEALRITRKGTSTVGAGSPGRRLGADGRADGAGAGAAAAAVSSGVQGRRRGWTSTAGAAWRRARPVASALSPAPAAAAPASQPPRGRAGEVQISTRSATGGLGLTAASSSTTSRGASRGSSSSCCTTDTPVQRGPLQRFSGASASPSTSKMRTTRKSTMSSMLWGW